MPFIPPSPSLLLVLRHCHLFFSLSLFLLLFMLQQLLEALSIIEIEEENLTERKVSLCINKYS